uniref:low-complexity tail membrane protein n=1 Tax=Cyanobium sp. TaxID=2164130 RepID=UPI004047C55F
MTARSEPLLWLQLIGLGAIPLELLLVLLLLAGSDPGPFPGLERLLTWGLGAVVPSVLLWRIPPDPFSLLLVCTPVRLRTPDQLGFSQEPLGLPLKLLLASGTALLLPLLWWLDTTSVLATSYALLPTPNRLAALVAVAPVLTLMVWQWQQLAQATVLLGRNHQQTPPPPGAGGPSPATRQPLCLGLPWLRLPALAQEATPQELPQAAEGPREAALAAEVIAISSPDEPAPKESAAAEPAPEEPSAEEPAAPTEEPQENVGVPTEDPEITDVEFTPLELAHLDDAQLESAAVAIEPEEAAEEAEGTDLDPQIG